MSSLLALAAAVTMAGAEPAPQPLGDAELAEQRAGFSYNGLDINFGVEIRSYLNNEMVLQTNFNSATGLTQVSRIARTFQPDGIAFNLQNVRYVLANQGKTAFIQRTDGAIQNIILNTASNVDLRQEVDATIDIAGFAPFRDAIMSQRIGSAISAMGALGLAGTAN